MFKLHIFVGAVHCFCQRSKSRPFYVRLLFYSIFISMLSIYYRSIILNWIFKKWDGGIDWVDLTQNRNRRRALVSAVMKLPG